VRRRSGAWALFIKPRPLVAVVLLPRRARGATTGRGFMGSRRRVVGASSFVGLWVPPFVEPGGELAHFFGVGVGEVLFFKRVFGEVVEFGGGGFVLGKNELPVVSADPAVGEVGGRFVDVLCGVDEEFAEDGVSIESALAGGDVEEVQAGHLARGLQSAGAEDRRGQIDGGNQVPIASGVGMAGPAQQDGGSDAAVVRAELAFGGEPAAGRSLRAGLLDPPVVDDEDDQGVFAEAFAVDVVEELTTSFIEPFAHGVVFCELDVSPVDGVLFEESLRRVMGVVGQEGGVPEEKGGLAAGINEVVDGLHGFSSDDQARPAMSALGGHTVGEAAVGVMPFPPLAGLETAVADLFQ